MSAPQPATATQVSVLTSRGRGAVAVVGVSGPDAMPAVDRHFRAANSRHLADQSLNRIVYGHWAGEDLVVCRVSAEEVELHCHGGSQSSDRIIATLVDEGCQQVQWEQWLLNHSRTLVHQEAQLALTAALTQRTASHLLCQYQGALERECEAIRVFLEEGDFVQADAKLAALLSWREFGLRLTQPWQVVIAGRPNVGKSSLLNVLAGYERAIVFDQPGTTRDVVSVTTALDGWPVLLSDTAGLHDADEALELTGIERAKQNISRADLVLWVIDAACLPDWTSDSADSMALAEAKDIGLELEGRRLLVTLNKVDLNTPPAELLEDAIPICATEERGIPELIEAVVMQLVPDTPRPEAAVPFTQRQFAKLEEIQSHCSQKQSSPARGALNEILHGPSSSSL